jgi:hypothetical protein
MLLICSYNLSLVHAEKKLSATPLSKNVLEPFLKEHCIRCHGPKKQKGKVRLDNVSYRIENNHQAEVWQDVLNVMNFSEMPPEDEPQPETKQFSKVLSSLSQSLFDARKRLTENGREVVMRKLNQREYANTIFDIFGLRIPKDMIPTDENIERYDTIGSHQFFSDDQFNKYFELGKMIVEKGFLWASTPSAPKRSIDTHPEKHYLPRIKKQLKDLEDKWAKYKAGASYQELGMIDTQEFKYFKERTEKYIKIRKDYLALPKHDQGNYLAFNQTPENVSINLHVDPRADYIFKIHGGLLGDAPITRQYAKVNVNDTTIGYPRIQGSVEQPGVTTLHYNSDLTKPVVQFVVWENRPRDNLQPNHYIRHVDPKGGRERIWIDKLEIEGPFYRERSFFETLTYPVPPKQKNQKLTLSDPQVKNMLQSFAHRAFRQAPVAPELLAKLYQHYQSQRQKGLSLQAALIEPLAIILVAPQFLYLLEAAPTTQRRLNEREFAIRLAYFLWSAPPDATLYALAKQNKLREPQVLHMQIERMLKDPRAKAFASSFMSQWSRLERFDHLTIPQKSPSYLKFNDGVKHFARQEPIRYFEQLLTENLSLSKLIDSDFVTVNHLLAYHYGLEPVPSDTFTKVALDKQSVRGGWLTQTAFLSSGTSGERSSPIIRGSLVLENILNRHLPPPPPDVPELGSTSKVPQSVRSNVELHKEQAQCSSCHSKIDPLGFGLENFDVMGLWRDHEKVAKKNKSINPEGKLPMGDTFKNIREMKWQLLKHEDLTAQSILEGLITYGMGREIEFSDALEVERILKNLKAEGYKTRSMVHHLIASPLFSRK